jgi:hypothetical protein
MPALQAVLTALRTTGRLLPFHDDTELPLFLLISL